MGEKYSTSVSYQLKIRTFCVTGLSHFSHGNYFSSEHEQTNLLLVSVAGAHRVSVLNENVS